MLYAILSFTTFILCSLIIVIKDFKQFSISLWANYIGILILLILMIILKSPSFLVESLFGALELLLLFLLTRLITHKGLGLGDIHYSVFCGLFARNLNAIYGAVFAAGLGIIVFLIIKLIGNEKNIRKIKIPFTPFMFLGCLLSCFIK